MLDLREACLFLLQPRLLCSHQLMDAVLGGSPAGPLSAKSPTFAPLFYLCLPAWEDGGICSLVMKSNPNISSFSLPPLVFGVSIIVWLYYRIQLLSNHLAEMPDMFLVMVSHRRSPTSAFAPTNSRPIAL